MRGIGKALFTNRAWEWTRTPKFDNNQKDSVLQRNRYSIPLDTLWIWELMFTLLGVWAITTAIRHININVLFILVPYTVSYGFVFLFSILQSRKANA
jgi:uncharacterized membrane protein YsdA (DUF1294 family)